MLVRFKKFLLERYDLESPREIAKFALVVANIYEKAPSFDNNVAPFYENVKININILWNKINEKYNIELIPVNDDPYSSDEEMIKDIQENNRLKVYRGASKHPIFEEEFNVKFRAVHDVFAHFLPNKRIDLNINNLKKYNFSYNGELEAYSAHAKLNRGGLAKPAFFSEIIGQASMLLVHGTFPVQKAVDYQPYVNFDTLQLIGEALEIKENLPEEEIERVSNNNLIRGK